MFHDIQDRFGGSSCNADLELYCLTAWRHERGRFLPTALMATERVTLGFTEDAIDSLADLASEINDRVENIGARRLHTVLERLLEEISFTATDRPGDTIAVDAAYVRDKVAPLAQSGDLSRFIL